MAAAPKSSTTSRHVGKSSDLPWRRSSGCVATAELVLHMDNPSSVRLSAQLRCGSRLPCVLNTLGVAVLPIASDDGASKIICIWSRADDAAEGPHESYPGRASPRFPSTDQPTSVRCAPAGSVFHAVPCLELPRLEADRFVHLCGVLHRRSIRLCAARSWIHSHQHGARSCRSMLCLPEGLCD